jgi:GMP synthase-like glutamine amidotransferase
MRALNIQNSPTGPADPFAQALEARGIEVETLHPYDGEPLPETLDGVAAIIAGGGLVDIHQADEHPWLAREIQLVREAIDRGTPFMGLCLGAQVLTAAAGGEVYRTEPHEIGWHEVELLPAAAGDPLFDGLPARMQTMQWHYYGCRLNGEGVELMRNPVALQALRVGDRAWGTQFHIEATRPVLLEWMEMGADELSANGYPREEFIRALDVHLPDHNRIGRALAERFAAVAAAEATRAG